MYRPFILNTWPKITLKIYIGILGFFANLRGNADAFWTMEMKEVQSVSLSSGIYLQEQ